MARPRGGVAHAAPRGAPRIPELLVLGDYSPDARTGPAIWLRCVVDGTIDVPGLPADTIPILYLPGVERGELRAGEDCPDRLKPLVELMYRGVLWHNPKGREWTVTAFLTSFGGPNLDIATDRGTAAALHGALDHIATTPVRQLRGHRLDAADFNSMAGVDVIRDILRWMGDPERMRSGPDEHGWNAFRAECRSDLQFDPETEADVSAGARLGGGSGPWAKVWARFTEAPDAFPGVPEVLARSRPAGELALDREPWPDLNDEDEEAVRSALANLPGLSHADACRVVAGLERDHAHRRRWVWARLGRSPLAEVMRPLARLAEIADTAIGGASPDDVAKVYAERGWLADAGAREALSMAPAEHEETVAAAVRHLLEPWLDHSARAFQSAVDRQPLPSAGDQPAVVAGEDECILFVDGLRYELGRSLAERLEARGCRTETRRRWAAIPTVTGTAKPAVTPAAGDVAGDRLGADFRPSVRGSGRPALAKDLRKAMEARGYQILGAGTLGYPAECRCTRLAGDRGDRQARSPPPRGIVRPADQGGFGSAGQPDRRAAEGWLEFGPRCDRSRVAAASWRPASGRPAQAPHRVQVGTVRRRLRRLHTGRASSSLALEPAGVVCLAARNRLLQPDAGVCPRRSQHPGMPDPGHPSRRDNARRRHREDPVRLLGPLPLQRRRRGPGRSRHGRSAARRSGGRIGRVLAQIHRRRWPGQPGPRRRRT